MCDDLRLLAGRPLAAPAMDRNIDELRELPREILHMHARAAVDVRRIFAGQKCDAGVH
jgi:hypothetical protein